MLRYSEIVTIALSAAVGYLGKIAQDWWTARQARKHGDRERWSADRQRYLLPLLGAARSLDDRLTQLAAVYRGARSGPFTARGLSGDFRELYLLSNAEIHSVYDFQRADPNQPRRDPDAVQRLRTRMCRELNFATSSLYQTARYLALAGLVGQVLEEGRTSLPAPAVTELRASLAAVKEALQGRTGAGLVTEQQDSIGEIMRTDGDRLVTQYEFRKWLLEVPGWEQFTALLTFFITENDDEDRPSAARFGAKVDYEVRATVRALRRLHATLDELTALETPRQYRAAVEEAPAPW
jgi:hypothetical protein